MALARSIDGEGLFRSGRLSTAQPQAHALFGSAFAAGGRVDTFRLDNYIAAGMPGEDFTHDEAGKVEMNSAPLPRLC